MYCLYLTIQVDFKNIIIQPIYKAIKWITIYENLG